MRTSKHTLRKFAIAALSLVTACFMFIGIQALPVHAIDTSHPIPGGAWTGYEWWNYWSANASAYYSSTADEEGYSILEIGNYPMRVNNHHEAKLDGLEVDLQVRGFSASRLTFYIYPSRTDASDPSTIPGERFGLEGNEFGGTSPRPKTGLIFNIGLGCLTSNSTKTNNMFLTVSTTEAWNSYTAIKANSKTLDAVSWKLERLGEDGESFVTSTKYDKSKNWDDPDVNFYDANLKLNVTFKDGAITLKYTMKVSDVADNVSKFNQVPYDEDRDPVNAEGEKLTGSAALVWNSEENTAFGGDRVTEEYSAEYTLSEELVKQKLPLLSDKESWENVLLGMTDYNNPVRVRIKYSDANRKAYDEAIAPTIAGYKQAIAELEESVAAIEETPEFSAISAALKKQTTVLANLGNEEDMWENDKIYLTKTLTALGERITAAMTELTGGADSEAYALLIAQDTAIENFEKAVETLDTEEAIAAAEKARGECDYYELYDLSESTQNDDVYNTAEELMARYNAANKALDEGKDAMLGRYISEMEGITLNSKESVSRAMSYIPKVDLTLALDEHAADYTARFNKAIADIKAYGLKAAGKLGWGWDITGTTYFAPGTTEGTIDFEAYNGYNKAQENAVGAILREKINVDGFTYEFTPTRGNNVIGSWYGIHLVTENVPFSAYGDGDTGIDPTEGLIALVVPYSNAQTEVQVSAGQIYQNDNKDSVTGYPKEMVDLIGKTVTVEWVKEAEGEGSETMVYRFYMTIADETGAVVVARKAYHTVPAALVEELFPDGTAYLSVGAWDQDNNGLACTINKINGEDAVSYLIPETDPNPDTGSESTTPGGTTSDVDAVSCSGMMAVEGLLAAAAAFVSAVIFKKRS